MDIMIQASPGVERFEQFCAILERSLDYRPLVNSMRTQLAIYSCKSNIEENMKLESLVPLLEDNDVLTSSEAQNLSDDDEPEKMLLSYLHHKGADKYLSFLNCLKQDGQHDLVRIIEEKTDTNANKKSKEKLPLRSRDSGIHSPAATPMTAPTPTSASTTPMTSVQATDLADGFSKLAVVKEEGSCDLNFSYVLGMIDDELQLIDEQYRDELERLERHYEEMRLILETKRSEARRLLGQLHWKQTQDLKDAKRNIRRGQRDQMLAGKMNRLSLQAKPDAYMKIITDVAAVNEIKQWANPVVVGSAHYSTTTAQGLGLKWAYTNKVALFTVEFRDIQNHPLIAEYVKDIMDLTSNFDCVIIDSEGSIVPYEPQIVPSDGWARGIMTITYMPTVTGYLDIAVKCSGHPITGSPFKVLAYPLCEYYKLMTSPQEVLCITESITGLTLTRSGDPAICTENGKLYILKHVAGNYCRVDVDAYHGGLSLNIPRGISCDSSDNLLVANTRNLQLIKASSPDVKEKLLKSRELKFEPICVAAHDRMVAAGGSRDVVICNYNLDILHTVTFSSSLSALTIANNLNVHVAVSETLNNKHYNYVCIENIDSKAYQTRYACLSPSKTASHNYRINDIVTDEEHNIIVCYTAQPIVAMFNSHGDLLSCYENWGSGWSTEFTAVAVSQKSGLLLVDQTKNKLLESHLDQNFGNIYSLFN